MIVTAGGGASLPLCLESLHAVVKSGAITTRKVTILEEKFFIQQVYRNFKRDFRNLFDDFTSPNFAQSLRSVRKIEIAIAHHANDTYS